MRVSFNTKQLPHISVKTNKRIREAIAKYRKWHIPMSAFLSDCLAVLSKGDYLIKADNPWEYFYKGVEGHEIESGLSVDETAFRFGVMKLINDLPSEIVNSAFYANKTRNDSDFEIGYLLPLFIEIVSDNDNVVIINPSPDMICFFEESECKCRKKIYAVPDITVAHIYKIQFPESEFISFNELQNLSGIDSVLLSNRDQKISDASIFLSCLSGCNDDARVLGLIPNAWFDSVKSNAHTKLEESQFTIKQALIVDSLATNSTPRKKTLVFIEKGEGTAIEVSRSIYDRKTGILTIPEEKVFVDTRKYLSTNKTLISLCSEAIQIKDNPNQSVYKKADEYVFSEEISLFYKMYSERKKKNVGIAYYKEIKSVEPKAWGKKLSPDIEKGLRADTKEEISNSLGNLVFDDKLYPIIRSDIEKKYLGVAPLTLKSIWFYCWSSIVDSPKYDHGLMYRFFSRNEVASILPQKLSGEVILKALSETLAISIEDIPFKYVDQIDYLLRTAKKLNLIHFNPLDAYIAEYSKRASERQQDVRNALVKKHFSAEEEKTIFSAIIGKQAPRHTLCVEKSLLLASAIRLFTGMSIREVAALKWQDYRPIADTSDFQFLITKFVDQNGKIMLHSEKQNWNRFRIVPSAKILTMLLLERKQYLLDKGIDEEYLLNCPIILGEERLSDMLKSKRIPHCKPAIISKSGNELIKQADIPENIIVLPDGLNDLASDFNRYHGDIFQTNFRDKSNHSARMTNGEINYVLGVDAPDTFSRHYCDYSNDFIQLGIIQKLCRWELQYEHLLNKQKLPIPALGDKKGNIDISAGPFENGVVSVDLVIENHSDKDTEIWVKSTHGLSVNTTIYEVKNGKDTD